MTEWSPQPSEPEPRDVYQVPTDGYAAPPQMQVPMVDPLVSPDYSGWWARSLTIVKRAWKPLAALQAGGLLLVLAFQAPVEVYAAQISERMDEITTSQNPAAQLDMSAVFGLIGIGLAAVLVSVVITAIVTLATVHIGVSAACGEPARIGQALRLAGRRVGPLIGWQLLAIPIYLLALCVCILPIFYVFAVFLIMPAVVAVERTNAISRCFSLFHADLGSAVARSATIIGITIASSVVAGLIGSGLDVAARAGTPGDAGVIAGTISSTLVAAVVSGVVAIVVAPLTLTAYADLRARRENTHGLVIAQELGITPGASMHPSGFGTPPSP